MRDTSTHGWDQLVYWASNTKNSLYIEILADSCLSVGWLAKKKKPTPLGLLPRYPCTWHRKSTFWKYKYITLLYIIKRLTLYGPYYAVVSPCLTLVIYMTHIPSVYSIKYSIILMSIKYGTCICHVWHIGMCGVEDSCPQGTSGIRGVECGVTLGGKSPYTLLLPFKVD